jgi:TctA family transporter
VKRLLLIAIARLDFGHRRNLDHGLILVVALALHLGLLVHLRGTTLGFTTTVVVVVVVVAAAKREAVRRKRLSEAMVFMTSSIYPCLSQRQQKS